MPPQIPQHAAKPPGILPKHAQAWVIGGISLAMVIVITFFGGKEPKERVPVPLPSASVVTPDDAKIREYRARIEQQAQKLEAEQARLVQTQQALGTTVPSASLPSASLNATPEGAFPAGAAAAPPSESDQAHTWMRLDREKREYVGRYASNVALSHRQASEMRLPLMSEPSGAGGDTPPGSVAGATVNDADLQQASGKKYRLFEGTILETILTNRLDGSFSGPVNCLLTTNVYSHDHVKLLIPQGSRLLGEASRVETVGQQRLAVSFHRLIMPDGYSVTLEKQPGLSQQGETGLLDQINHHYLQLFGVSIAVGAVAGLSQANTQYGVNATADDAYRQGVASSLSQTSLHILDRYLNVLPTFTIREGQRVKVYLMGDLLLPAYDDHRMPGDL